MAEHPPPRQASPGRPEFVMSVWRDASGAWRGRLKSLRDGAERAVADVRELPGLLDTLAGPEERRA
ncbi:hypothetical protein [Deinococcus sp. NW-56]|uniref:hypothetical protein n=1 Tax=Deinococcus sp. NW-56 TaxID=2080419 RepID=UPI000CF4BB0D|nr:hypothetical protein [Deinococcus sp. NW-56]